MSPEGIHEELSTRHRAPAAQFRRRADAGGDQHLRRGDLVIQVADERVRNPSALLQQVEQSQVGQPLPLTVLRGQKQLQLSIRPAALPHGGGSGPERS